MKVGLCSIRLRFGSTHTIAPRPDARGFYLRRSAHLRIINAPLALCTSKLNLQFGEAPQRGIQGYLQFDLFWHLGAFAAFR